MSNTGFGREEDEIPPSAAAREHAQGKIDARPPEEYPHAGLVQSDRLRSLLSALHRWYSPERAASMTVEGDEEPRPEEFPERVEQTQLYQQVLRTAATETADSAVRQGDEMVLSYLTGKPDMRKDISGLSAITSLEQQMMTSAPILYIWGPPGAGKTNFALLLSEIWRKQHEQGEIASNIRTWREKDRWIPRYPALEEWMDEQVRGIKDGGIKQREDANPRLFVFDEASSNAAGHGEQGYETRQKLAPMLFKIRKANAGLIIIGHDGKDVHPAIRTLSICVERRREEVKKAILWEDVRNRQGKGKILELDGIPETSYSYDDTEATSWNWGSETTGQSDEEQQQIEKLAADMTEREVRKLAAVMNTDDNSDLSQREIGRLVGEAYRGKPYTQSWVSKWTTKYDNGELQ
jgi:hypothetical protein